MYELPAGSLHGRFIAATRYLANLYPDEFSEASVHFRRYLASVQADNVSTADRFGFPLLLRGLEAAVALSQYIDRAPVMAKAIVVSLAISKQVNPDFNRIMDVFGVEACELVKSFSKVTSLYDKASSVKSENFHKLMLAFSRDLRVVIMMLADRLSLMKAVKGHHDTAAVKDLAFEAIYLYAPLAHRLGFYKIKQELEELWLKYTEPETYRSIAEGLSAKKAERDRYIAEFIGPVREKLRNEGLKFEIKGRTKSIYSIWNKMRKQHNDLDHIYDLFAVRIILDSTESREKADCWTAYSLITDMYTPNPARMRDWVSIPKANGYESLHATVQGPENKWVEVQIRTRRMDAVAEKGLAAHWKYKGVKAEDTLDAWMGKVRDMFETSGQGPIELIKSVKLDIYDKEVFVFSPKGDIYHLPLGATLLDFAFNVHTSLGTRCTGGKVNGKNCRINKILSSGDTVEITTSATQTPKPDWLNFVVTNKAKAKIRASIKEKEEQTARLGKELLERRFKNRKIDLSESVLSKAIRKAGFKSAVEFNVSIADGTTDIGRFADLYQAVVAELRGEAEGTVVSAAEYDITKGNSSENDAAISSNISGDSPIVIGQGVSGVDFRFAKCCNPMFGDKVFGFVSSEGTVKIHRLDCPNASHIRARYPYRIVAVAWSGDTSAASRVNLKIVGKDDIAIVSNIVSVIKKDRLVNLRNISIDSTDGLFQGLLVLDVMNMTVLASLVKKLRGIKGVKSVNG